MKKFIIDHDALKASMKRIKPVVPSKPTLPVLGHVLMRVGAQTLTVIATDLDITIQCVLAKSPDFWEQTESYDLLVDYDFMNKVLGVTDLPLEFTVNDEIVEINTGSDLYCMGAMPDPKDFPALPIMPKQKNIELNGVFIESLNAAVGSCTKDETRPALNHVCVDIDENGVYVVATDAHQLYSRRIADAPGYEERLLISPRVAKVLDGFTNTKISWTQNVIAFQSENITIVANRADAKFPSWRVVFPTSEASLLEVSLADVTGALEKCNISEVEDKSTVFHMSDEQVDIETKSYGDGRRVVTKVSGRHRGEIADICLNSKKLHGLLGALNSKTLSDDPQIEMSLYGHSKAVVITTPEDASYKLLIMPIINI